MSVVASLFNSCIQKFIFNIGWENTIVNTGTKMQEFMQDKASIKDVADQLDEDQDSVVNNQPEVITTYFPSFDKWESDFKTRKENA